MQWGTAHEEQGWFRALSFAFYLSTDVASAPRLKSLSFIFFSLTPDVSNFGVPRTLRSG